MKKINSIFCIVAFTFAALLSSCASSPSKVKDTTTFDKTSAIVDDKPAKPIADGSGFDITNNMKAGWNLGNTLDATNGRGLNTETSWHQPRTTKEMIDGLAASGIKTIRIPTSWSNHLVDDNYSIDPKWMERVKEIVDWAIEADMYVILNCHHDNFERNAPMPPGKGYYPTTDNFDESCAFLENLWAQIARAFNDGYDEHLVFETLNEPRLRGTQSEWTYNKNNDLDLDAINCLNQYNQLIVDTIRKSGGNNAKRLILVPGLQAGLPSANSQEFVIPTDPVENTSKIGVSIHMYSPYNFAMENSEVTVFDNRMATSLQSAFDGINYNFIKKGVPVVITEYGATNKNNLEERVKWFSFFIRKTHQKGIPCCLWDNGAWEAKPGDYSEKYGYYNRKEQTWYFPEILDAIVEACESTTSGQGPRYVGSLKVAILSGLIPSPIDFYFQLLSHCI